MQLYDGHVALTQLVLHEEVHQGVVDVVSTEVGVFILLRHQHGGSEGQRGAVRRRDDEEALVRVDVLRRDVRVFRCTICIGCKCILVRVIDIEVGDCG